ncbi:protein EFR3 homolog cmp44E-like isoform X1 [Daphnia carinata]|uniref:protein EFR3 homolog cmp44E-like isoform X1 n=1 Tax=Daphnia carinata TaxID=120202 RepID=UPI002580C6DE|nr:protein EFR3 homolog cmp44E-like isoform X1 [Daphnia carinata]
MSVWSTLSDSSFLEMLDSVLSKCDASHCCCGCCAALRPRYKRLVDNIFPVNPEDGLVRSNMDKLTFYSMSSPEKLDRIGEYLAQRVSRDIYRHRNPMVIIAMEAMDQLLLACHAQSLNLFVESFLKTVQKLLETTEPALQILASQSFVKFANIEEDTPSYHRRYDFFVSKFASLCHSNHPEVDVLNSLRLAGLRGIQGVVRKTVSDDLVENIWEPVHMDKIVPSLLYNMQHARPRRISNDDNSLNGLPEEQVDSENSARNIDPSALAENCLRELVGRASFGNIRSVIKPVFKHLDLHELWVPNDFAIYTFRVIMYSIQVQYSYAVVENLMMHLDTSSRSRAKVRTSMANVLAKIIAIAAGESVGPSVLEIVNSLLKHLKQSIMSPIPVDDKEAVTDEKHFQESLISALAEFAYHLPDYQKIEIMMFIIGGTPGTGKSDPENVPAETLLQHMLLKCLLKVSHKYKSTNFSTSLPLTFLDPLLRTSLVQDAYVRVLVQEILHCLLDRHDNRSKLKKPSVDICDLNLAIDKCSRADSLFYKNHGSRILVNLSESLDLNNVTRENIEAIYCTAALICVELATDEMLVDILRWALAVQDVALTNTMLHPKNRLSLHVVAISIVTLASHTMSVTTLVEYSSKVVTARNGSAPHLLNFNESSAESIQQDSISPECLLDFNTIADCMKEAGKDIMGMIPLQGPFNANQRYSWADSSVNQPSSFTDLSNINLDGSESNTSSPGLARRYAEEEVTFEALKKVLAEPVESRREAEYEKRQVICEKFRNTPFQQLVASSQSKGDVLNDTLNQILTRISVLPCGQPELNAVQHNNQSLPHYGNNFPDLFVY